MGVIAELPRQALGAWSPGGHGAGYIACASYSPDSTARDSRLELLSVDITRSKLSIVSEIPSAHPFSSIHWSAPSRPHPAGLIAAGFQDGGVTVWDAATMLRGNADATVFGRPNEARRHHAAVNALAFNPVIPARMATGAADACVMVWDLSNPSGVNVKTLTPNAAPNVAADPVTTVAWNRKVQHILASANAAGVMNVWDLRQSKQLMSIRNPRGRFPVSSTTWHPDIATQIVITCDSDEASGALLWDLRNATAPVRAYRHHAPAGVVSSSWSTHDTDLLLTSSRDSRTVAVSVKTGEVVAEAPKSANWNFDVKWSPRIPGLYLSSSFDGRLTVNSILTASMAPSVSSETANALAESFGEAAGGFQSGIQEQSPRAMDTQRVSYNVTKPPKWLKRQAAVSLSFGGLQAYVGRDKEGKSCVHVDAFKEHDVGDGLTDTVAELDDMLMDLTAAQADVAQTWCAEKAKSCAVEADRMSWEVLGVLFGTDCRRRLIEYLGFKIPPQDVAQQTDMPVCGLQQSAPIAVPKRPEVVEEMPQEQEQQQQQQSQVGGDVQNVANGMKEMMALDGPAPWELNDGVDEVNMKDSLLDGDDTNVGAAAVDIIGNKKANGKHVGDEGKDEPGGNFGGKSKLEMERIIKDAVIVGDFKTAVDACLHVGRAADALVIGHAGGAALWSYAQTEYVASASVSESSKIVSAIVGPKSGLEEYIRECVDARAKSWKEALAVILTYTPAEELNDVCTALGMRLLGKKEIGGAIVSFLCGGNSEMTTKTWLQTRTVGKGNTAILRKQRVEHLADVVTKVRVMTAAHALGIGHAEIGAVNAIDAVSGSVLCEFAALVMTKGDLQLAITYLSNLDGDIVCAYGSARDLLQKGSEGLAREDASREPLPAANTAANPASNPAFPTYGAYDQQNYYTPAPPASTTSWTPASPPPPSYATPALPQAYSSVSSPPPPQRQQPQPHYQTSPVAAPALPPTPAYNPYAAPTPSLQPVSPMQQRASPLQPQPIPPMPMSSMQPPPPAPATTPVVAPAPLPPAAPAPTPTMPSPYMAPPPMGASPPSYGMLGGTAAALPPPPPPPPSDNSVPPPMPYHARATRGSGAALPPSAEIAVAETRRAKPLSSSGMPGAPPRRNVSTSSSLSAMGGESVPLDKADFSKLPANLKAVVNTLRNVHAHAAERNQAPRYRKKIEDVNKRLGKLVTALNGNVLDQAVVELVGKFAAALDKSNYTEASVVVTTLTRNHWDSNSTWIQGLKRLIDCVVTGR